MTSRGWLLIGVAVAFLLIGCATVPQTNPGDWTDLIPTIDDPSRSAPTLTYSVDRIESDYHRLVSLARELKGLADEMVAMRRTFVFRETPYLSDQENKQVEFLLFRFVNARDALWEMITFYREAHSTDPEIHTQGSILGMSAGLNVMHFSSLFVALFLEEPEFIKLANAAHPRYEIPAGMYDSLAHGVTSIEQLEWMDVAWYLFCKGWADPVSTLSRIRDGDSRFAELIDRMDHLHAGTHIHSGYVLHARLSPISDLTNRLEHSRIVQLGDQAGRDVRDGLFKVRGRVFRDVARIKNPGFRLLQFSDAQIRELKEQLQPGDLLFTYTSGYMSNVFLPGVFKHGITYLGSVEERQQAGLTEEVLARHAVSDRQYQSLVEHVYTKVTREGHAADVVEAVAEGVVLHSLDEILTTHINRLVVIRPRITGQERQEQLVTLLQYIGAGYDFSFNFQDDTYQCCTELIYRTTSNLGSIDYALAKTRGLWALAADDILRYYLTVNPDAFSFVVLAEQDPRDDTMRAVLRQGPDGLQRLYEIMAIERP